MFAVLIAILAAFTLKFVFKSGHAHRRCPMWKKKLSKGARRVAHDLASGKWPKPKARTASTKPQRGGHMPGRGRKPVTVEELAQQHCRIAFDGETASRSIKPMKMEEIMRGKPPPSLTLATSEAASARMAEARTARTNRQMMQNVNSAACRIVAPAQVLPPAQPFSCNVHRARTLMTAEQAIHRPVTTPTAPLSPRLQKLLKRHASTPEGSPQTTESTASHTDA